MSTNCFCSYNNVVSLMCGDQQINRVRNCNNLSSDKHVESAFCLVFVPSLETSEYVRNWFQMINSIRCCSLALQMPSVWTKTSVLLVNPKNCMHAVARFPDIYLLISLFKNMSICKKTSLNSLVINTNDFLHLKFSKSLSQLPACLLVGVHPSPYGIL